MKIFCVFFPFVCFPHWKYNFYIHRIEYTLFYNVYVQYVSMNSEHKSQPMDLLINLLIHGLSGKEFNTFQYVSNVNS